MIFNVRDFSKDISDVVSVNNTQNTKISALETRATTIESVDTSQNSKISALETRAGSIESVNTTQNSKISALETRATSIESVNTTQTNRLTALETRATNIESVNSTQNTKISALETRASNIETLNTTQNNRLTALETKTTLNTLKISDYVTMYSGYSIGGDSFIRKYGNIVELYLVILGDFKAGASVDVGTIKTYIPYAAANGRRVAMIAPNGGLCSNLYIEYKTGKLTVIMPPANGGTTVMFNLTYLVS